MGLVVGSQGSQIKRISEQYGVAIYIDKTNSQGEKRKITIYGKNERDVEGALEEVDIQRAFIPFDNSIIDYVYGHKMKNLDYFHEKSGVVQLDITKNQQTGFEELVVIGTLRSIEDLKIILQTHINLYDRYQEQDSQRKTLQQQQRKVYYNQQSSQSASSLQQ